MSRAAEEAAVQVEDARGAGLQAELFRLGGLLGMDADEVVAFGEAVASRPWQRCGPAEFEQILEEFREVVATIVALQARRRGAASGSGRQHVRDR